MLFSSLLSVASIWCCCCVILFFFSLFIQEEDEFFRWFFPRRVLLAGSRFGPAFTLDFARARARQTFDKKFTIIKTPERRRRRSLHVFRDGTLTLMVMMGIRPADFSRVRSRRPDLILFFVYLTLTIIPRLGAHTTATTTLRRAKRELKNRLVSSCILYCPRAARLSRNAHVFWSWSGRTTSKQEMMLLLFSFRVYTIRLLECAVLFQFYSPNHLMIYGRLLLLPNNGGNKT